ncbi:MAG: ImmA/IrrE family metallo-endopeptidase [Pseudomonadota bacterium]
MSKEAIPINPAVLTWARTRAGFSIDEAKEHFKDIEAWEDLNQESGPSYPQLEKLADKFKTPIAVFFFPEPPDLEPIGNSFRTMPEQQFELIPRQVRFLLRKAKALQLNLAELNNGHNPAAHVITRELSFPVNVSIADMATAVRNYLGITLEQQMGWASPEKALESWRHRLHDFGIFVFKDAFKQADFSGFCLYDDAFPVIYVNNSTSKTRQIFTLFHELAHLLFHTSGVDKFQDDYIDALAGDAKRIEILCNRFAARFLVPDDAFEQQMGGLDADRETASLLAGRFHVSREVIYRMMLDRNLINQAEYTDAAVAWAGEKKSGTGGDYYNNQIAYLGPRYISLAFQQYYNNRIDQTQLADYLNIAPRNVGPLEEKLIRREA